ncbi:putative methylesterase 11, chloroplastic isoform X2 [Syzygium oleosum]|uniref:putative methylesterase 11, chloroplastic isoform X2 n=1 Tax=Syzygium oleosum TaxID=219896 RepID=UPI0024BA08B3|nr:putative methylesterase 11, chloroplastic isoform X2 [Syzygium oleosum]
MGNLCTCFSRKPVKKRRPAAAAKRIPHHGHPPPPLPGPAGRWSRARSSRRDRVEALTQEQAAAAAVLLRRHQQNGGPAPFDRSASLRYPSSGAKKQELPRSSSSRPRSLTDPLLQPHQIVSQEIKIDDLETDHFILVHGGGFGAWCWYKTIALLEEGGFKVTAIDLTGSGIHSFDTNGVTSLSQYVKPLTDFLEKLADGEKVILVGHDFGGACISYAMELLPSKISKAIFVAAAMLTDGQSTLDMFAKQAGTNDLMQQTQVFLYANGNDNPPTAIDLDKSLLRDLLYNRSPAKDVALASVSMRPIPFAPVLEKLSLSNKYSIVRRFYVETSEDNAITLELQESMVKADPPERIFLLRGADHSPFFSKPQGLHKILVEISRTS